MPETTQDQCALFAPCFVALPTLESIVSVFNAILKWNESRPAEYPPLRPANPEWTLTKLMEQCEHSDGLFIDKENQLWLSSYDWMLRGVPHMTADEFVHATHIEQVQVDVADVVPFL